MICWQCKTCIVPDEPRHWKYYLLREWHGLKEKRRADDGRLTVDVRSPLHCGRRAPQGQRAGPRPLSPEIRQLEYITKDDEVLTTQRYASIPVIPVPTSCLLLVPPFI